MRPVFADGFPGDSLSDLKTLEPKKTALQTSKGRAAPGSVPIGCGGRRRRDGEGGMKKEREKGWTKEKKA